MKAISMVDIIKQNMNHRENDWIIKFNNGGMYGKHYFSLPRYTENLDDAYGFRYKKDACEIADNLIGLTEKVDRRKNFRSRCPQQHII